MKLNVFASFKRNSTLHLIIPISLYIVVLSYLSILKHNAFMSTAWDLGIYEQVVWSTANTGRLFWYTPEILINPSCNFFGIHFSPFLFVILPIYYAFQSTETLLILQVSFLALGAVPLYKIASHEDLTRRQALVFVLLYLTYPPIYGMVFFDFHVQAFLPFLFFFSLYYFKKEEWGKYVLFIILSLMVIEFVPLIVVFFGFYGLWVDRREILKSLRSLDLKKLLLNRRIFISFVTVMLGIVWFLAATKIISSVNPFAPPHPNWQNFGDPIHNLPEFVTTIITNPLRTLQVIFSSLDQKMLYIFGLFAPVAFLSFLDLPSLMIGFPWFLVAFLSNYPPYYTAIGYQYIAFVTPFIFASAIYGFKRLSTSRSVSVVNDSFNIVLSKILKTSHWKAIVVILLAFIMSVSYFAATNINITFPVVTEHERLLETFTKLIPPTASVLTQNNVFPHLSKRLYAFGSGKLPQPIPSDLSLEYAIIDTTSPWCDDLLMDLVLNLTKDRNFAVQYAADGIWLLKCDYKGEVTYPVENGVFVNYYNQGVLESMIDENYSDYPPTYESLALSISGRLGQNIPASWKDRNFTLTFEGWLYTPISGEYWFQLESAGFSNFTIDGYTVLRVENDSSNYGITYLERGFHFLNLEYKKAGQYIPFVVLLWKPPWELQLQEIQLEFIYPEISPEIFSVLLKTGWDIASRRPYPSINKHNFSAFINFNLRVPSSGVYSFQAISDDKISISFDDELVLSPFRASEYGNQTLFKIFLSEGNHLVKIDYIKQQENSYLNVRWQPPGTSQFEDIPLSNLHWQKV